MQITGNVCNGSETAGIPGIFSFSFAFLRFLSDYSEEVVNRLFFCASSVNHGNEDLVTSAQSTNIPDPI